MFMSTGWSLFELLFMLLGALLWASVIVWIFAGGVRRFDYGRQWLHSNDLAPGPEGVAFARTFARRNLVLRVIGGTSGLILGGVFDRAVGVDSSAQFGFWAWITTGWMIGAWWADRSIERRGEHGAASLVPRRLRDYLSRTLLAAPMVLAGGVVVIAVVSRWGVNEKSEGALLAESLTSAASIAAVAVACGLALLTFLMQRAVLSRHQPLMSDELRRIDDTARSTTLHNIGGAGTAAVACVAGYLIHVEVRLVEHLPMGMRGWLPALPMVTALVAWRLWAFLPWQVRRAESLT